jgi:hypothetical protein
METAPLALHAEEAIADLECQVVAGVLRDWAEDGDVQLGRRGGDLGFRYGAFSVRRQHERMFAYCADESGQPTLRAGASPQRFSSL